MIFKVLVVILFLANVVALGTALVSMIKGQGKNSKKTARLLFIRVSLAAALIIVIAVGFYTGDLGIGGAPWLGRYED